MKVATKHGKLAMFVFLLLFSLETTAYARVRLTYAKINNNGTDASQGSAINAVRAMNEAFNDWCSDCFYHELDPADGQYYLRLHSLGPLMDGTLAELNGFITMEQTMFLRITDAQAFIEEPGSASPSMTQGTFASNSMGGYAYWGTYPGAGNVFWVRVVGADARMYTDFNTTSEPGDFYRKETGRPLNQFQMGTTQGNTIQIKNALNQNVTVVPVYQGAPQLNLITPQESYEHKWGVSGRSVSLAHELGHAFIRITEVQMRPTAANYNRYSGCAGVWAENIYRTFYKPETSPPIIIVHASPDGNNACRGSLGEWPSMEAFFNNEP